MDAETAWYRGGSVSEWTREANEWVLQDARERLLWTLKMLEIIDPIDDEEDADYGCCADCDGWGWWEDEDDV